MIPPVFCFFIGYGCTFFFLLIQEFLGRNVIVAQSHETQVEERIENRANGPIIYNKVVERMAKGMVRADKNREKTLARAYRT